MAHDPPDEHGRVLPFPGRSGRAPPNTPAQPHVEDVGKYAQGKEEPADEYRHRQITNVIAFAVCILLVAIGIWLADTIAQMRRDQDCALAGRRNCARISVPANR
jgi:hypothetical protein